MDKNEPCVISTDDAAYLRRVALASLARREHSRYELQRLLVTKKPEAKVYIAELLDDLQSSDLLSDERFLDAYIAMRKRKGFGPVRLQMELRERGLCDDAIDTALASSDHDWEAEAKRLWDKKFGRFGKDSREKAKQFRFLQYRGFAREHFDHLQLLG